MSSTQERINKRREYLKKKGAAYTEAVITNFFGVPLAAIAIVLLMFAGVGYIMGVGIQEVIFVAIVGFLCGGMARIFFLAAQRAQRAAKQLPYVPPVTANTLPAEEVLVRGAEEPKEEQSRVLLRSTDANTGTAEQELLRGSQGKELQP